MKNKPVIAGIVTGILGILYFVFVFAINDTIRNTAHGTDYNQQKIQKQMLEAQKSQAQSLKEIATALKGIQKKCGK